MRAGIAAEHERQQVMGMWETVFHESKVYMDLYFGQKYQTENCVAVRENGRLISSLQILPYAFLWEGSTEKSGYLSGVATLPECRGRGAMALLLRHSFGVMRQRGYLLTTLIPAGKSLFWLYWRHGFATAFRMTYQTVSAGGRSLDGRLVAYQPKQFDALFALYDGWQKKKRCAVLKNRADMHTVLEEHRAGGGMVWLLMRQNELVGAAFAIEYDGMLVLKEVLAERGQRRALIDAVLAQYGREQALCMTAGVKRGAAFAMARLLNVPRALQLFAAAHPDCKAHLSVTDAALPENNGSFILDGGTVKRTTQAGTPYSVEKLTAALLTGGDVAGYEAEGGVPFMNLMLN